MSQLVKSQYLNTMKKIIKKYFEFIYSHIATNGYFYNINRFYCDGTNKKNILSDYLYAKNKNFTTAII